MTKKEEKKKKEYTLDSALKSTRETETDLQGLLKGVEKGAGFYHREAKAKVEEGEAPQLKYDKDKAKKLAEDYISEDIPISERKKESSVKEKPSFIKEEPDKIEETINIYQELTIFFEKLFEGYQTRYSSWEDSISSLLGILRKMRKITKKNTEDLVNSINIAYDKIKVHLEQFKLKRDEIEKIAEVDIQSMSGEFKKVLGLLELQVKEYQLKRLTDEHFHI